MLARIYKPLLLNQLRGAAYLQTVLNIFCDDLEQQQHFDAVMFSPTIGKKLCYPRKYPRRNKKSLYQTGFVSRRQSHDFPSTGLPKRGSSR